MVKSIQVSGMHCHHCVNAVRGALTSVSGLTIVEVDIGSATIKSSSANDDEIRAAIDKEGYRVTEISSVPKLLR
ncbi:MAG: cation transporter [Bacteroidetes bacterium]|nr:cation transporter [Bacteroidota bacterium]